MAVHWSPLAPGAPELTLRRYAAAAKGPHSPLACHVSMLCRMLKLSTVSVAQACAMIVWETKCWSNSQSWLHCLRCCASYVPRT